MNITCPHCQSSAKVSDEHLGRQARCKKCGGVFRAAFDPLGESDGLADSSPNRIALPPALAPATLPTVAMVASVSPGAPVVEGQPKKYYLRPPNEVVYLGPYPQKAIDDFIKNGEVPNDCDVIDATVEGLLVRLVELSRGQREIQKKQLELIWRTWVVVLVAFVLVFIFGLSFTVK